jgi:hypothetical protein
MGPNARGGSNTVPSNQAKKCGRQDQEASRRFDVAGTIFRYAACKPVGIIVTARHVLQGTEQVIGYCQVPLAARSREAAETSSTRVRRLTVIVVLHREWREASSVAPRTSHAARGDATATECPTLRIA